MDVPLMKTPKAVVAIYFCQKPVCLPLSELAEYVLPSFIPSNGIIMLIAAPSRICAARHIPISVRLSRRLPNPIAIVGEEQ